MLAGMKNIATAIAALAALTLVGCGADTTQPKSYENSDAIIEDVRASNFDCELDPYDAALSPGVVTSCITEDGAIVARTFENAQDYDTYRDGMTGPVIFGDLWAVECTDLADCEHVQGVTGGGLLD